MFKASTRRGPVAGDLGQAHLGAGAQAVIYHSVPEGTYGMSLRFQFPALSLAPGFWLFWR